MGATTDEIARKAGETKAEENTPTEIVENTNAVLALTLPLTLVNICKYLNRQDVLNLRLLSSRFRDAVNRVPSRLTGLLVAASAASTIFLDNGSVFTCGANYLGQLGHNDTTKRLLPTRIPSGVFQGKRVAQAVADDVHTIFVCEDGSVFACGFNALGQLEHNDMLGQLLPTLIPSIVFQFKRVVQVVVGAAHTIFVCEDDSIFTCGNNAHGQLGHNDTTDDRLLPTLIPSSVFQDKPVVQVVAGATHTIFIYGDGSIFSCGNNENGQLGHNDRTNRLLPTRIPRAVFQGKRVAQAVADDVHTIFVCEDGSVFTCGLNIHGQLGHNDTTNRPLPTLIPSTVFQDKPVVQAVAGAWHTIFVCEDGSVFTCGANSFGQLGHNDTTNRLLPTQVLAMYNPYREATQLRSVLLQNIVDLNKKNRVFCTKVGAAAERILDNTQFGPAIPGVLLKVLNLLNGNACYDKNSTEQYKSQIEKDIAELTASKNAQPPFAPLFQAARSKITLLEQEVERSQSFSNSQAPVTIIGQ